MKKILYIFLSLSIVLSTTSCEGFLDTVPSNSASASTALKTLTDAEAVVNGIYEMMMTNNYYGAQIAAMGELLADDIQPTNETGFSVIAYRYDFEPSQNHFFYIWTRIYNVIMRTNTVLNEWDNIPAVSAADITRKNNIKGQALALRALCYFDLARLYGQPYGKNGGPASLGASIVTTITAPSESKIPRSTVAETYAQIERDLDESLTFLSSTKTTGKINIWGAKLLKARVMLYKGEWASAYSLATDVINNGGYSLVSNANYVNSWSVEGNTESVFEILMSTTSNAGTGNWYHGVSSTSISGLGTAKPTQAFLDLMAVADANDVRQNFIDPAGTNIYLKKFLGNSGTASAAVKNIRVLRLAEAYFIAAEAGLKSSQTNAKSYLDAIKTRANPAANLTYTFNEDEILTEKRKEFVGEGHRFYDMMRLNKTITRSGGFHFTPSDFYSVSNDNYRTILPISRLEINYWGEDILKQNPGYAN